MQQVLEHHALAAGRFVLAEPRGDLVDGADERALGVAGEPGVEVGVARRAAVELRARARARRRASRRSGSRSSSSSGACGPVRFAGALDLGADAREARRVRRTACCTRRRSARPARRCRACRCRRRGSADAAAAPASAARARPRACSRRRGSRRAPPSRGGGRSRAARRSARAARSSRGTGSRRRGARAPSSRRRARARSARRRCGRRSRRRSRAAPGSRKVAGETSVPKRSVVVRAASPASVVQASCATFAVLVRLRDVVVGAEERVDPVLLARVGEGAPLLPGDALLALDHQRDAHRRRICLGRPTVQARAGRGRRGAVATIESWPSHDARDVPRQT